MISLSAWEFRQNPEEDSAESTIELKEGHSEIG